MSQSAETFHNVKTISSDVNSCLNRRRKVVHQGEEVYCFLFGGLSPRAVKCDLGREHPVCTAWTVSYLVKHHRQVHLSLLSQCKQRKPLTIISSPEGESVLPCLFQATRGTEERLQVHEQNKTSKSLFKLSIVQQQYYRSFPFCL